MQIFNQNRPTIIFIQHHLICSHTAVVCKIMVLLFLWKLRKWFSTNINLFTHN